jgi:hypothetical protein
MREFFVFLTFYVTNFYPQSILLCAYIDALATAFEDM